MTDRGAFASKIGFVAAAAGSAVGLGNIWRFPYEAGRNGGAAFLLVYLVFIVIIGYPIMVGEVSMGRSSRANPYRAYKKLGSQNWKWVGVWGIVCGIMFLSVYNVVAGWAFGYFVKITFGDLLSVDDYGSYFGAFVADVSDNFFYSLGFMVITAIIVSKGIQGGIEKVSKILMPILFFLLIGLIIYSLTLPNAIEGVKYYLIPDFGRINIRTLYTALGQAFFSLSLGMGALITYGSYIGKKDNIAGSAGLVTLTDTLIAFLAGLMIFPLVFSQGQSPEAGPGLVFVALPGIFHAMGPVAGKIIGSSFFLLLCFAALTSTISLLEIPTSFLVDERKWSRKAVVWGGALAIFLIGLPSMLSHGAVDRLTHFLFYEGQNKAFFDMVFDVFNDAGLPLGGLLMVIFISRKWGMDKFDAENESGNESFMASYTRKFLHFSIKWVSPVLLAAIFIITILQKFLGIQVMS
jgi:NSS family neurotransmitter:Na+ symporter